MKKVQKAAFVGLLIAIEIVLTRFLAFEIQTIRIGLGFIPIALTAILFGPVTGGIMAVISDILGMIISPKAPYFPGFTLSALIVGVIYGIVLHKKKPSVGRTILAVSLIVIIVDITLNTIWLSIILGETVAQLLLVRVIKSVVMMPAMVVLIYAMWESLAPRIEKLLSRNRTAVKQ